MNEEGGKNGNGNTLDWIKIWVLLFVFALILKNTYAAFGIVIWGTVVSFIFFVRPGSAIHDRVLLKSGKEQLYWLTSIVCVILAVILPMGINPVWNGENPAHRIQYEVLADSILNGHLYMENWYIDPKIFELDNPYNPVLRDESGISMLGDCAFYNGKCYMYFGVVPVFLLFIPYKLLTGHSLTTYRATQFFAALAVIGIFMLFRLLKNRFFKNLPVSVWISLSVAFSLVSLYAAVGEPGMYCVPAASAICFEVWSLYFYITAVWIDKDKKRTVFHGFMGALFGALTFGCRPPLAIANIIVLPMIIVYLKEKGWNVKGEIKNLLLMSSPYFMTAALLMAYNYARFGDVTEFGVTYALTVVDLHEYGSFASKFNLLDCLKGAIRFFIDKIYIDRGWPSAFPHIMRWGAWVNFPIFLMTMLMFTRKSIKFMKSEKLLLVSMFMFFVPFIVAMADAYWNLFLCDRYRMDILYLMGILCFIVIGIQCEVIQKGKAVFCFVVCLLALLSAGMCFLLFVLPDSDGNYTVYYPEFIELVRKILYLGN